MLKNLFRIPDTFDPDDRRRRQVLNILLIIFILVNLLGIILVLWETCCIFEPTEPMDLQFLFVLHILTLVIFSVLLIANRSRRIPGWLNGMVFVIFVIAVLTQADTPYELYNGRSTIVWTLAVLIGAAILRPGYIFVITGFICVLMQFFTPLNNNHQTQVNYYSMLILLIVAFTSWLGMSIANRAIRDARREAAHKETVLNSIADGVLVLDQAGNFLSANPALLNMIPEEELQEILAKPLGESLHWKQKIYSITASDVPEVGTVAVIRDETRRRETERAKEALIATASHELRTPLAAVMNYLELLLMLSQQGKVNTQDFTEHLTRALENSRRLHRLVNNILDQAQIQAGTLELSNEPFDLRALLEKAQQLLEVLLKEKRLAYELNVAPDVPAQISGDAERLHQVLVNLIGNAIKFTSQGGIKVKVTKSEAGKLSIEVADSGIGIPPEQLPDIFEAFRRGSNYAQREHQGAGLGLSIVKEIVTRMGGEISAASRIGSGSTFTVIFPIEA